MKRFAAILLLVVTASLLLFASPGPVHAQEGTPQPTPTATPAWMEEIPLPSGGTLLLTRTISYGDAAIVAACLALLVALIVALSVVVVKQWI